MLCSCFWRLVLPLSGGLETDRTPKPCSPHLLLPGDGATLGDRGDVVLEVAGQEDGVLGGEGTRLAIAHAGLDGVGAPAAAPQVALDGDVEG